MQARCLPGPGLFRVGSLAHVNAWPSTLLGQISYPMPELCYTAHEEVISITVCTQIYSGQFNTTKITLFCEDYVGLAPVLSSGVSLGYAVLGSLSKKVFVM